MLAFYSAARCRVFSAFTARLSASATSCCRHTSALFNPFRDDIFQAERRLDTGQPTGGAFLASSTTPFVASQNQLWTPAALLNGQASFFKHRSRDQFRLALSLTVVHPRQRLHHSGVTVLLSLSLASNYNHRGYFDTDSGLLRIVHTGDPDTHIFQTRLAAASATGGGRCSRCGDPNDITGGVSGPVISGNIQ